VQSDLTAKPNKPPPSPPVAAEQEQPEHGDTEEPRAEDLFALDTLLTSAESKHSVASQVRPRPAWRTTTPGIERSLPSMAGKAAVAARNFGTGPGSHGGQGGDGRRKSVAVKETTPFGGANGSFRGQVCSIPVGTASIRSLGACESIRELYTDTFNIPTRAFDLGFPGLPGHNEWFAILYTGSFEVEKSGLYEFRLASDDGSILQIDGALVVDNDGTHGPVSRRGKAQLAAGRHELRLRYFQGPRNLVSLQLFVTPPGRGERLFRPSF
jgi:PA14 domain